MIFRATELARVVPRTNGNENRAELRLRVANPFKWRCTVATTVETAVAMVTTMLVAVFLVAIVVYPEPLHAQTARDTEGVAQYTDLDLLAA